MKIALLTDGIYPYVLGGMQRHSYFLAKYLAKNGVQIDLYHFNQSNYAIDDLAFFTAEERKNINSIVLKFPHYWNYPGHYLIESYHYSMSVFEALQERMEVDFIYAKGFSAWKLLEEKKAGKKFPPIGVKFHGLNPFQPTVGWKEKLQQGMLRPAIRFNLKQADYAFSYGGKITELLKKIGLREEKIIEMPTGIERELIVEQIPDQKSPIKFIYIGRYERIKGLEEINETILNIGDHAFEFHFVGPIPEGLKLKNDKVKYWGQLSEITEVIKVLDQCDVLVCPSYSEGMPNVIMEAMARALIIIGSDVGAIPTLVGSENGWLISAGSQNALELAMKEAINSPTERLKLMKKASREKLKKSFLWENLIQNLIQKIQQSIEK